jgi:hypothetical protein
MIRAQTQTVQRVQVVDQTSGGAILATRSHSARPPTRIPVIRSSMISTVTARVGARDKFSAALIAITANGIVNVSANASPAAGGTLAGSGGVVTAEADPVTQASPAATSAFPPRPMPCSG